jgi:hypothetical protein
MEKVLEKLDRALSSLDKTQSHDQLISEVEVLIDDRDDLNIPESLRKAFELKFCDLKIYSHNLRIQQFADELKTVMASSESAAV